MEEGSFLGGLTIGLLIGLGAWGVGSIGYDDVHCGNQRAWALVEKAKTPDDVNGFRKALFCFGDGKTNQERCEAAKVDGFVCVPVE